MGASSELLSAAENIPPVLLVEEAHRVEPCPVEFEEFPRDSRVKYDWMLQPASHRNKRRLLNFVAATAAVLLIVTFFLFHNLSKPSASVLASPRSSQQ